jgi:DNA polymerase-3 subunit delta'
MSINLQIVPRLQKRLIGHEQPLQHLVSQLDTGRLHPAWLLSGQKGIGKATLSYQFARHILTFGQENSAFYESLIDQNAHPNLFVLERTAGDDGKLESEIKIDKVRALSEFVHQSPAIPGWRVVIIDAIDELNRNAANSILKILEEPPQQLLFLMVCHCLGNILPTIRSRCCLLPIKPLTSADLDLLGVAHDSALLAELSGGSIGGYIALRDIDAVQVLSNLIDVSLDIYQGKVQSLTAFCGTLDKKDNRTNRIPELIVWLSRQLVLCSAGITQENEISEKIYRLSQLASPQHWLKAQTSVTGLMELSKGAYADPIHLIQALLLLLKMPQSYQP